METLKKIDRGIAKIEEFIVSASILFMSALLITNVILRTFFNYSFSFSEELGQIAMIILTFIGTAYAVRKGQHINMSAAIDFAPFKGKKVLQCIVAFGTMLLMFAFAIFSFQYLQTVIASGRVTPTMEMPRYLVVMFVPVGFFLAGIQYLINFVLNIKYKDELYLGNDIPESQKENLLDSTNCL